MNTLILYAMGIASLAVIIAGAFFLVVMIVYGIQDIWAKVSACAKNVSEYLLNKRDFELYKRDVKAWDDAKRVAKDRCKNCRYRQESLKKEAHL